MGLWKKLKELGEEREAEVFDYVSSSQENFKRWELVGALGTLGIVFLLLASGVLMGVGIESAGVSSSSFIWLMLGFVLGFILAAFILAWAWFPWLNKKK